MPRSKDKSSKAEVTLAFKVDGAVLRRLEQICQRADMSVPGAMRMLLVGAVQRGDFNWSPWDSSVTDNGYMPYETIKKRRERARKAKIYFAKWREARLRKSP